MKSGIVETEDKVFIEKIPRLKWGENTENSFIRSAQLSLNAPGENYSYEFLMGISGFTVTTNVLVSTVLEVYLPW